MKRRKSVRRTQSIAKRGAVVTSIGRKRHISEENAEHSGAENDNTKRHKMASYSQWTVKEGNLFLMGMGDLGQLGLGPDCTERSRPTRISDCPVLSDNAEVCQACAGGVHTVCALKDGSVYTFGCNDEHALGRETAGEEEEMRPALVSKFLSYDGIFNKPKITQISAGDSHTAFLSDLGQLFLSGTFRDSSGSIGLLEPDKMESFPRRVLSEQFLVKVVSGTDHVAALNDLGELFTMGCAEQGQLGRVPQHLSQRGGRFGLSLLLQPAICRVPASVHFADVWAGSASTLALAASPSDRYPAQVYACGLNNYGQLGVGGAEKGNTCQFMLAKVLRFNSLMPIKSFALGQHHTLILTEDGRVFAIGRKAYGRLGVIDRPDVDKELGDGPSSQTFHDDDAVLFPVRVNGVLSGKKVAAIACGGACSFALDGDGVAYAWGMSSNKQLGSGTDEEDLTEPGRVVGKQIHDHRIHSVSSGGQHTVLIAAKQRLYPVEEKDESGTGALSRNGTQVIVP